MSYILEIIRISVSCPYQCLCYIGIKLALKVSLRTLNHSTVGGVYCEDLIGFENFLCLLGGRIARGSSSIRWPPASSVTFVLNSLSSSSCMNFVARCLSSSMIPIGFLHRLSEKGHGLRIVTRWWRTTFGIKSQILRATLPNLSNEGSKCFGLLLLDVH